LADVTHRRPAQNDGPRNAGKITFHQGNSGALDCDFGARSHGDPDSGFGQSRGVVHAIPSHGDNASLGRKSFDDAVLVLRQNIGFDFFDAELASDSLGSHLVVAG